MSPKFVPSSSSADPLLAAWLWTLAALVFAMVLVGGATRLTDSGLSITEWQPLLGAIPPLDDSQWREAFEKYKAIPEYQIVNRGMSLAEFKQIYWWEWAHRFLGRIIALVLLIPFLALWLMGRIDRSMAASFLIILALGALQGALGWYMVKSGLAERTDVSQYRLSAHLILASVIYAAIIWVALGLTFPRARNLSRGMGRPMALLALILVQIGMGGLVAGLDAGRSHNTFPLMDGRLVPDGLMVMTPWWRNIFENPMTAQFLHRLLAYGIALAALLNALSLARAPGGTGRFSAWALVAVVALQMALGIWTLLSSVPLHLGLLHQAGAMLLLGAAVAHLYLARTRDAEAFASFKG
jgi:cytochrome c oxidase assembly protein subunit 15